MAITTATIQHRRGNLDDFNPDKMVPGELAFTTDGSRKVFAAFAPGDCKELASTEEVQGIVDAFKQTAQGIVDDALHDIEEKADESLARIPEFADKANVIVVEKSGEVVTASDSSNDAFAGLNIYGKSTQETTTGKNLLENTAITQTKNGVTFTMNEDGSVTLNGTASAWTFVNLNYVNASTRSIPVGEYIVSGGYSDNARVEIIASATLLTSSRGGEPKFEITESNSNSWARITVDENTVLSNVTVYPMIRLASITDATYEPYTGGIAAPNPDYPQEVVNCENTEVSVYGKNLLPIKSAATTTNGVTITPQSDGSLLLNGTATGDVIYAVSANSLNTIIRVDGTKYTMSFGDEFDELAKNYDGKAYMVLGYRTDDIKYPVFEKVGYKTFEINNVSPADVFARIRLYAGAVCNNVRVYPQIELGETYTGFEVHKTIQSLSIPYTLCGIPVTDASIANYTDDNGQMWVCDEVDFEKGVYVQRVKSYTFVGSSDESWGYQSTNASGIVRMRTSLLVNEILYNDLSSKMSNLMCNMFKAVSPDSTYLRTQGISVDGNGGIACYTDNYNTTDSVEAFKTHLSSSPMTVLYVLATPIETALTAEQIAEYKALRSNYPNTTVMNDSGAGMGVKFRADTQKHIEQNYVPVSEFQALVNRISTLETLALS